jgi:hypothetical protein
LRGDRKSGKNCGGHVHKYRLQRDASHLRGLPALTTTLPKQAHRAHTMFQRLETRLRETGSLSLNKRLRGSKQRRRTPDIEEAVIECFEEQPDTSTRSVAHTLGVTHMSVGKFCTMSIFTPTTSRRCT